MRSIIVKDDGGKKKAYEVLVIDKTREITIEELKAKRQNLKVKIEEIDDALRQLEVQHGI